MTREQWIADVLAELDYIGRLIGKRADLASDSKAVFAFSYADQVHDVLVNAANELEELLGFSDDLEDQ